MNSAQYQVLVRSRSSDLFLASVLGMEYCVGEGRTREEAIAKAKAALVDRLARGEIVTIEVDVEDGSLSAANVWLEESGRFLNDPTFEEFVTETEAERCKLDSEDPAS